MAAIPERAMIKVVRKARGSTVMFSQTRPARVFIQSTTAMMVTLIFPFLKFTLVSEPEQHFR